jgi:GT2 family glycosyltransferase
MNTPPRVAFLLVCWNNQDLLSECFDSIQAQTYKNHVTVVVDNGSKDDSVAYTNKNYSWVDVHEAKANLGFAKGNNVAIQQALEKYPDTEYFVFLNTDARLASDWLEIMVDFAGKKPRGALFQSITVDYYNASIIDSTHIYISRNGSGTQAHWRNDYRGEMGPKKVFGVNAAAAMVSRKFVEAQPFGYRLFDEKMFMYLEDVDVSARATIMGWDNYLVPGTLAYHMGSASSGKKPGFSLYMTYRNNAALLCKNLPFKLLIKVFPEALRSDYHTMKHLKKINQSEAIPLLIKARIIGALRLPFYIPEVIAMRKYRKKISREYLWKLMHTGM